MKEEELLELLKLLNDNMVRCDGVGNVNLVWEGKSKNGMIIEYDFTKKKFSLRNWRLQWPSESIKNFNIKEYIRRWKV